MLSFKPSKITHHMPARLAGFGLVLLLSGCALSPVTLDTRQVINDHVHTGMTMPDARAELESLDYRCELRSGSWFDAEGREHPLKGDFISCTKQPGWIGFVCNERTRVILVPNGTRLGRVSIYKAPSCIKR